MAIGSGPARGQFPTGTLRLRADRSCFPPVTTIHHCGAYYTQIRGRQTPNLDVASHGGGVARPEAAGGRHRVSLGDANSSKRRVTRDGGQGLPDGPLRRSAAPWSRDPIAHVSGYWLRPSRRRGALEPQGLTHRLEPGHDVGDMLLERDADLIGAAEELIARDLSGETPVLHLLDDCMRVDLVEAATRPNVGDCYHEARKLVARVDRPGKQARAGHAGVVAVAQNRVHDLLRIADTP